MTCRWKCDKQKLMLAEHEDHRLTGEYHEHGTYRRKRLSCTSQLRKRVSVR